jgi:tRNA threonylcarbamoyladenosine biosynthesis protein TsaB
VVRALGGLTVVLVLAIETSTRHTSVALGSETGTLGATELGGSRANHELIVPALERLLGWIGADMADIGGIAVDIGPGLFTGMRVGIATAKTFAQALGVPVVGLASLDVLAFMHRGSRRSICAVLDAKRREVFYAFYRPVPAGVQRDTELLVGPPSHLVADIEARAEETLVVGGGALVYRRELESVVDPGGFASAERAFPAATAMVELAVPRFVREEHDDLFDLQPIYLRKTDAEIAWDQRIAGA